MQYLNAICPTRWEIFILKIHSLLSWNFGAAIIYLYFKVVFRKLKYERNIKERKTSSASALTSQLIKKKFLLIERSVLLFGHDYLPIFSEIKTPVYPIKYLLDLRNDSCYVIPTNFPKVFRTIYEKLFPVPRTQEKSYSDPSDPHYRSGCFFWN